MHYRNILSLALFLSGLVESSSVHSDSQYQTPTLTEQIPIAIKSPVNTADQSDAVVRRAATRNVKILYNYRCPIGGNDNRVFIIKVTFDGKNSKFENVQNSELLSNFVSERLNPTTWKLSGMFGHNFCLARAQGRKCAYTVAAILVAHDSNGHYSFETPSVAVNGVEPTVIETCTQPNSHASDCTGRGGSTCDVLAVFPAP